MGFRGCGRRFILGWPRPLGVRAKKEAGGARSGRTLSPARPRGEEGPDRWGPPVGGREKGEGKVPGWAGSEEAGPAGAFWASGEKR